ncbi:intermediate cleaving peptidase 55, mitochondrial isoform X1 [Phragmites australis]|uniref:intermediate cleaving peptidase 55, mitochondrial isoform X1 n=2 Tax=Phragmites australis TaxID=29695 RepID=UPI002D786391|nr:intermediate cleaving peptidase 55, mitochondrial isoform X1 [Phragmites australis]
MAMAARLLRRTALASEVASRFLSASHGLVQRAAYTSGGIVDVGQPTPQSHPKLLADGEITPGIPSEEYISRRTRLLEVLPEKSLAIIASADQQMMTDVVPYPFRQSGDYLYITGCIQPGGVAVLSEETGLCMFMPDTDKEDVLWQGQTAGVEAAVDFFKADKAFPLSQMQKILPEIIERSKVVYHNVKTSSSSYRNLDAFRRASLNNRVKDLTYYTDELRWIKSKSETRLMRESASIVSQSLLQTMLLSRTHKEESQLAAKIEYECKMRGAQRMAFHPVVGGGANGSVIHYSRNDRKIKSGELLLMDVGCEYHGYLSDLTRTWPPCGRFSPAQEELYSLILETNKECIKLCKPGASINEIHNYSVKMLIKGFQELGILEKGKSIQYNYLNPTAIGHSLGMDIHDSVTLTKDKPLEPGVIITIEPGIYIPPVPILNENAPDRYRGIGIRIEDEVLITENGHEVLTASVPKEIPHLTTLMSMGGSDAAMDGHELRAACR